LALHTDVSHLVQQERPAQMKRGRPDHEAQPPPKKLNAGPKVKDAMGYLEKVKQKFSQKPQVYNQFLDIMKDFKSQAINTEGVIDRVKTLFKGNRHLILGFNQFLPPGYKIELPQEPREKKTTIEFNHAVQYVAKIKNRFREQPEIYGEFLDILHDYQANRTIDEVFMRVQKLFGGQPDLLDEFKYFLPAKTASSSVRGRKSYKSQKKKLSGLAGVMRAGAVGRPGSLRDPDARYRSRVSYPPGSEKDLQLLERLKTNIPRQNWTQFVKVLHLHTLGVVTRLELVTMAEDILGEKFPEYVERFKNMIGYDEWEESQRVTRERKNYYTFVASVDFTSCPQPTPSYRRIPDDIPLPSCSGRTPLCDQVLNNRCISIPTGSEDFSFKATRKNIYEENLFKCEDERFELDMVIENNASAIRILEPLEKDIQIMTPDQAKSFVLPKSVDILHVRAIARMYGDHGYQIIDLLKKNPTVAIPIILARLRQKDEEWRRVRVGMKDNWRRIAAQNYNKSLDHRSFYFKQEDKKRIIPKALILNLKDLHDYFFGGSGAGTAATSGNSSQRSSKGRQPDTEVLRQLQAGMEPLFNYCMRFKYPDASIHKEVLATVKFALNYHPDIDAKKCLEFWESFIHHFFGVDLSKENEKTTDSEKESKSNKSAMEVDISSENDAKSPSKPTVKPVRLSLETWAMDERVMPIRRHTRKSRLFFGTTNMYVLLRLHEMLYTRLYRARELAFTHKNKATKAQLESYAKSNSRRKKVTEVEETSMEMEDDGDQRLDEFLNGTHNIISPEKSKKVIHPYDEFTSLLRKILSKEIDTNHFEDELRALLGAKSFMLFTVDKLVTSLLKQLNIVAASANCASLVDLYKSAHEWTKAYLSYMPKSEAKESKKNSADKLKLRRSAQTAKMYQDMCATTITDDLWCQMEYFEDTKELAIGLLDGTQPQRKPGSAEWVSYCKQFLSDTPITATAVPFLPRNLRKSVKAAGWKGLDEKSPSLWPSPTLVTSAMKGTEQYCGLEFRINTKDFKLMFVDDTEDIFVRRKNLKPSSEAQKQKLEKLKIVRSKSFSNFVEKKLKTMGGKQ